MLASVKHVDHIIICSKMKHGMNRIIGKIAKSLSQKFKLIMLEMIAKK